MQMSELDVYQGAPERSGYAGPTWYKVPGYEEAFEVAPWNHPSSLANYLLKLVKHTIVQGVQVMGPQGYGKSSVSSVVAHHIHVADPRFVVRWAGPYEFTHQEEYFETLEKLVPHVIIFDDVTGALNSMTEKQIQKNFNSLTQIRKFLDPNKKTPAIFFVCSHYSLNVDKGIRAQMPTRIFVDFGAEERTNILRIADRNHPSYKTMLNYSQLVEQILVNDEFQLKLGNGKKITYKTDNPFRCACVVSNYNANLMLFAEKDVCERCVQKQYQQFIDPEKLYQIVKSAYGEIGVQALRHSMVKRGHLGAVSSKTAAAIAFLEESIFPLYTTNFDQMTKFIYKSEHRKTPKHVYRKRKLEEELSDQFAKIALKKPIEDLKSQRENTVYDGFANLFGDA